MPGGRKPAGRRGLSVGPELGDLELDAHLLDPGEYPRPEFAGHLLGSAVLVHQPLHHFFEAVLPQARPALVQVLADQDEVGALEFAVDVAGDPCEYLAARCLVRFPAAHDASSSDSPEEEDAPSWDLTRPRSAA